MAPAAASATVAPVSRTPLFGLLREATVGALRDSVGGQMPAGPLRDHYLWWLDPGRAGHRQFLRATGVAQLVRLYGTLTDGLVDEGLAPKVAELLSRIAVYQTYEIVTDNLAHGLFASGAISPDTGPADRDTVSRRLLIRSFNAAATVRLCGGGRSAAVALAPERRRAARVSMLDHGLSAPAHRRLAAAGPADDRVDVWPALVVNVEAALDVAATAAQTPFGPTVRHGLIDRYRAVSRTLSSRPLSRLELAVLGARSVLVVPTLGYCLAVVADLTEPVPGLADTVADGTLGDALFDAAVLARLLNDVGTGLLRLAPDGRRAALASVRRRAHRDGLRAALDGPPFGRLARDLRLGEFNLCLYAARRAPDAAAALTALEAEVDYFATLYALHSDRLTTGLAALTRRLADPRPARLVRRFVRFHERLYARSHDTAAGDYTA